MRLSIIIPAYNEEKTIKKILSKVRRTNIGNIEKEIIVIDDGSKDKTKEILSKEKNIVKIFQRKNYGKGWAIRTGLKRTTGDIIIIQDADMEYDPNEYGRLLKPILKKKTKVVYGSRFLRKHKAKYKMYYLGNRILSLVTKILYTREITDMETCYKVFKKDVIKNIKLKSKKFDFEPEITAKIIKRGYKIIEVPIWYQCRDFKEGKKITWKDGLKAMWSLLKYRFVD